jgi:hypothetical protein
MRRAKGTVSPPIFRLWSAPPKEVADKNVQHEVFRMICGLPQAFYRDLRPATIVIMGGKE